MQNTKAIPLTTMAEAVMPGTPNAVIESYAQLPVQAATYTFGLIEDDVVVLDTETTGLSRDENELIEISAARLRGREIVDTFDTFVKPSGLIPEEITKLTSITNADVAHAPTATEAVEQLAQFVQGAPVIAHNAAFDRGFIEVVPGGEDVTSTWIDSLALSRIALPRLNSHKLSNMAELFGCAPVSHRACDDVEALCGVWRILLCGLVNLPAGLLRQLADMHSDVEWSYRPIFSFLAGSQKDATFSLIDVRKEVLDSDPLPKRMDASELDTLQVPTRDEVEALFAPEGLVDDMYESYEPRAEQVQMAIEVRDALATSSHRVIEAGTGVGKSIAYLTPLAKTAKRNNITVGVATKTNNLADQLMFHELPRLNRELPGGLSYCALKGFDHYPCLRKLERLRRAKEIDTPCDPADTLTAIAVIYAFACQSPTGDMDGLGIRWRRVNRGDLTSTSRECLRNACPFYPHFCLVHGARRRAARSDVVVTNHSLLFRDVASEGAILPPIRHWVVDEAHSMESEARRQWARTVSADDTRSLFERLGNDRVGALSRVAHGIAASEDATLFLGLIAKTNSSVQRASLAMASMFDALREFAKEQASHSNSNNPDIWLGPDVRESYEWNEFIHVAGASYNALDEANKNLASLVKNLEPVYPTLVSEIVDSQRRMEDMCKTLKLIIEGTDNRYVYSCQVNLRIKAGGESLKAELLDIGEALAKNWLPNIHAAILTSATMSIAGNFEHFNHAVGLDRINSAVRALHLDSSYDFKNNMSVVVTSDMPDPRNREAYLDATEQLLLDVHITMGGSVLTLFTNRRDMEELYNRVEPKLRAAGLSLNYQRIGTSIKVLRNRFIENKTHSLFALKAFWEGFDAAGSTLRCVVIPKLPFSVPTDPLSLERKAREDNAWAQYSLPEAVLEVKQAAGRLIRSSTDTGVLVLGDVRLVTKGYGAQFLNSLPAGYQKVERANIARYIDLWCKSH